VADPDDDTTETDDETDDTGDDAGDDIGAPVDRESLAAEVAAAVALLESMAENPAPLALVDDDLRRRLRIAAGKLSRPDRYTRKALSKALVRERKRVVRTHDRSVLDQTGIRALRREPMFRTPLPRPVGLALDGPVRDEAAAGEVEDAWSAAEARRDTAAPPLRVVTARLCYVCKTEFHELHDFYDQMCAACADLNWRKRNQTADLRGRVCLVTGARVKIGYQAAIKLLRGGAETIVVTRFPHDAARRFTAEVDASDWIDRLHVHGVDLRHTPSVEALCAHLLATYRRLDALVNNACQTVRRPAGWYDHVMAIEAEPVRALPPAMQRVLERHRALVEGEHAHALAAGDDAGHALAPTDAAARIGAGGLWRSAVLAQVPLLAEDLERGSHLYPEGRVDADLQQVDLRDFNSWRMTLADVPTAELLEVHLVNAVAPFVMNARLKPLLAAVPTRDSHVVNVSAMEGQFYRRWKTDKHPHTNMAKAALNMMTRTSAADYVKDGVHMNSVDTGWVTDEDPVHHAVRKREEHGFHPPLDIVDGAARIVDPLLHGVNTGEQLWGMFLKDYKPAPW
jgi:NAD(P)-dependent dehydrogenase (short-subunit alcohol dehydrogenase family)